MSGVVWGVAWKRGRSVAERK